MENQQPSGRERPRRPRGKTGPSPCIQHSESCLVNPVREHSPSSRCSQALQCGPGSHGHRRLHGHPRPSGPSILSEPEAQGAAGRQEAAGPMDWLPTLGASLQDSWRSVTSNEGEKPGTVRGTGATGTSRVSVLILPDQLRQKEGEPKSEVSGTSEGTEADRAPHSPPSRSCGLRGEAMGRKWMKVWKREHD